MPARSRALVHTALGLSIAVVLLIAAVVVMAVAKPSALANRIAQQELPALSKQLGRPVQVDRIEVRWFPVRAVIHGLRVGGAAGEPDLLDAPAVTVRPRLWPLVTSRGRDVQIASVRVDSPTVNLVRLRDGRFDLPLQPQGAPAAPRNGRRVTVGRVALDGGTVRVYAAGETGSPLVALRQIHLAARDLAIGAPLQIAADAALGSDKQNLHARIAVASLPASAAALRAHPPHVEGTLSIDRLQLQRFRALMPASVQGIVEGGALSVNATVAGGARLDVSGSAALADLSLRGKPASASFDWTAQLAPANPESAAVQVSGLKIDGPGVDLGGSASASLGQRRARFALDGALLDLDVLLASVSQRPSVQPRPGEGAQVHGELERLDIAGTLKVRRVVAHRLEADDLDAIAQLRGGVLALPRARASFYGGALEVDGAEVDLARPVPAWRLRANLSGVELGDFLRQASGAQPLVGRASGSVDLSGEGSAWRQLRQNLTGTGSLLLARAALATGSLGEQLAAPLRAVLPGAAGKTAASAAKGTPLENLGLAFAVRGGFLDITRPIAFDSDVGKVSLSGRIGLDGRLELTGSVDVAPSFIASVAGKGFAPKAPLQIPVRLNGTLERPSLAPAVSGPELAARVAAAAGAGRALQGAQNAAGNIANQARRAFGHLRGP